MWIKNKVDANLKIDCHAWNGVKEGKDKVEGNEGREFVCLKQRDLNKGGMKKRAGEWKEVGCGRRDSNNYKGTLAWFGIRWKRRQNGTKEMGAAE